MLKVCKNVVALSHSAFNSTFLSIHKSAKAVLCVIIRFKTPIFKFNELNLGEILQEVSLSHSVFFFLCVQSQPWLKMTRTKKSQLLSRSLNQLLFLSLSPPSTSRPSSSTRCSTPRTSPTWWAAAAAAAAAVLPVCVFSVRRFSSYFCPVSQVLISMVYLPDVMPASFQATYTPVESAGTDAQIKHLARLMATQMTAAGIGPGQ